MKHLILISLLLFGLTTMAQTFTIKGVQKFCDRNIVDFENRDLSLLQNDSMIIEDVNTKGGYFKIEGLTAGVYTFRFTDLFGHLVEQEFELSPNQAPIIICTDEFDDSSDTTLFETLNQHDTLTLKYASKGCSHAYNEYIDFYYQNGVLIGELYVDGKRKKKKKLGPESLDYLIWVERRIKMIGTYPVVCTTKDQYDFLINGQIQFSVYDGSCEWGSGYYRMRGDLF